MTELDHRILDALQSHGPATVERLARIIWPNVRQRRRPAAAQALLGVMMDLIRRGLVQCQDGLPTPGAVYRPARAWRRAA